MPYDSNIYLTKRDVKEIEKSISFFCKECSKVENPDCLNHNGRVDVLKFKIRDIPWSKRNQILSAALSWDGNDMRHFDGDYYVSECLKFIIIEAPWGPTNDLFLTTIGEELGGALESLVPTPLRDVNSGDGLKKG